jgi:hypothetical protein
MPCTTEAASQVQSAPPQRQAGWRVAVDTAQWREMLLLVAASLLATVPVWLATYPPMVDLPQHAAQIALLRNLHDPSFRFADLFWVNWFTPYLFGYMLVYELTPLLGIVAACKFVVAVALAAVPLSTSVLMRETGAPRYWALLTIPAIYGFSYHWGFLNFLVATPIGLLFLALVIAHTRKPTLRSTAWVALFSLLLFFSHALIYFFFGVIACVYALLETGKLRRAALAVSPVAAALPLTLIWYLRTRIDPGAQEPVVWDLGWITSPDPHAWGGRLTGFFPRMLGIWPAWLSIAIGIGLFALPLLAGARLSKRVAVWAPLAVCLAVVMFAPAGGHSGWAFYHRFTVFVLPFFVIGLEGSQVARSVWRAAVIFLLVGWMTLTVSASRLYAAEARGFAHILSAMEPGERALSLMFIKTSEASPAPVFLHFPAWYSATKQGVVDRNFAVFPVVLVRFRPSVPPPDPIVSEWHPQTFRWREWRGGTYRYFVVHAPLDLGYRLFAWAPCPVSLVAHSDNWWLYEKDARCSSQ